MKLIKRIKNLWKLSELEIPVEKKDKIINVINEPEYKKPVIIKRVTPVQEFLKNEEMETIR